MAGTVTVFPILQTGKLRHGVLEVLSQGPPPPTPGMSEALEVVRCSCSVTLEILLVLFQPELIQYFSEKKKQLFFWFISRFSKE